MKYQIFFSSETKSVYGLLKDFYDYHKELDNLATILPHYVSHKSPLYKEGGEFVPNCLDYGKYCAAPRPDMNITDGHVILYENLRQKCIYNLAYAEDGDKDEYWQYMINFYDKCINATAGIQFTENCAYDVIKEIGLSRNLVEECVAKAYKMDDAKNQVYTNKLKLLEQDYNLKKKYHIKMIPTMMVNNRTILGAWKADNLLEAVCAGLEDQPKICEEALTTLEESEVNEEVDEITWGTILFVILLVVLINVAVIYICRKYIIAKVAERMHNTDINGRITNVVSSYMSLRDP